MEYSYEKSGESDTQGNSDSYDDSYGLIPFCISEKNTIRKENLKIKPIKSLSKPWFVDKFTKWSKEIQESFDKQLIENSAGDSFTNSTDEDFENLQLVVVFLNDVEKNDCVAATLHDNIVYVSFNCGSVKGIKEKVKKKLKMSPFDLHYYMVTKNKTYLEEIGELMENSKYKLQIKELIGALKDKNQKEYDDLKKKSPEKKLCFEKLESYCLKIIEYFKTNNPKIEVLANTEKVHAELVIFEKILAIRMENPSVQRCYNIAATKLACEFCRITLDHFNIIYNGSHRRVYAGPHWNVPTFLKNYDNLFEKLFECLYICAQKMFQRDENGELVLNEKSLIYNVKNAHNGLIEKIKGLLKGEDTNIKVPVLHKYPKLGITL